MSYESNNIYCDISVQFSASGLIFNRLLMVWLLFLIQIGSSQLFAQQNDLKQSKGVLVGTVLRAVNLRIKPNTQSKVLIQLRQGYKLRVLGLYKKKWYWVNYKGRKAWVWSKNLKVKAISKRNTSLTIGSKQIIKAPFNLNTDLDDFSESAGTSLQFKRYRSISRN